jgi:hypothetical protein
VNFDELFARALFHLKTVALRGRFMLGKASFVRADLLAADHHIGPGQRILSHYDVETRRPRTGTEGWFLFERRFGPDLADRPAALECGYCGHLYVIDLPVEADPLAAAVGGGRPLGLPVSCASNWFEYPVDGRTGPATLSCGHCEQIGRARVRVLS